MLPCQRNKSGAGQVRLGEEYTALRYIQNRLEDFLSSCGYQGIDTPVLEPVELYLPKSGWRMVSQMYIFSDAAGRRLALRPEFTASVIKTFMENEQSLKTPVRWRYCGPVFRHDASRKGSSSQFIQLGAELIGAVGPTVDAEVVSRAWEGLRNLGLSQCRLVVGHVGIQLGLLDALGISEQDRAFLISSAGELAEGPEGIERVKRRSRERGLADASEEGLMSGKGAHGWSQGQARAVLADSMSGEEECIGSRSREEIIARFVRKGTAGYDSSKVEEGVSLLCRIGSIKGNPSDVLQQCLSLFEEVPSSNEASKAIEGLEDTLSCLISAGIPEESIILDVGLSGNLAYYSGIVFEIRTFATSPEFMLCGGGRYDGLAKALSGDKDIPALGFAFNLDSVFAAMGSEGKASAWLKNRSEVNAG